MWYKYCCIYFTSYQYIVMLHSYCYWVLVSLSVLLRLYRVGDMVTLVSVRDRISVGVSVRLSVTVGLGDQVNSGPTVETECLFILSAEGFQHQMCKMRHCELNNMQSAK